MSVTIFDVTVRIYFLPTSRTASSSSAYFCYSSNCTCSTDSLMMLKRRLSAETDGSLPPVTTLLKSFA